MVVRIAPIDARTTPTGPPSRRPSTPAPINHTATKARTIEAQGNPVHHVWVHQVWVHHVWTGEDGVSPVRTGLDRLSGASQTSACDSVEPFDIESDDPAPLRSGAEEIPPGTPSSLDDVGEASCADMEGCATAQTSLPVAVWRAEAATRSVGDVH